MQKILIDGVGKVAFPDSMSDADIKDAIQTKILPKYAPDLVKPKQPDTSYLQDAVQSGANFITGFGNAVNRPIAQLANLLAPQSMQVQVPGEVQGTPGALGGFTGDLATQLVGAGALNTARAGAEALPVVGQAAKALGGQGVLPTMARLGTGYGAYNSLMNPQDRLGGAESGFALGAFSGAADKLVSKLFPSNSLSGLLSPQQLQENVRITQGTNTPLGDIVGSGGLKKDIENWAFRQPFSGADQKMAQIADQVSDKGKEILAGYLGDTHPLNVNKEIGEGLKNAANYQTKLKNDLYKNVEDLADGKVPSVSTEIKNPTSGQEIGPVLSDQTNKFKLTFPSFSEKATEYNDLINDKTFLQYSPKLKSQLKGIMDYDGDVSLKDANILSGKLNTEANKKGASPLPEDRDLARIYGELGSSLKNDIRQSIEDSGNAPLKDAFEAAERNYKENFSEFLDKDIYDFTKGKKKEDQDTLLQTFIKTGKNSDQGNQIDKLMSKLDPKTQDLVKYSYLTRGMDPENFNPNIIKNALSPTQLGITQKAALFRNPGELQALEDYSKLVGMNSESLSRMFNAMNGQRAINSLSVITHLLGGGAGAAFGGGEGGSPGAFGGAVLGFLAPTMIARELVNRATSQSFRNDLINKMIQKQQAVPTVNKLAPILSSLYQNTQG